MSTSKWGQYNQVPMGSMMTRQATRSPGLALIAAIAVWISAYGSPADPLTDKVDMLFAQYDKAGSPGCALGIIKDGRLIYARGYGSANPTPCSSFRAHHNGL